MGHRSKSLLCFLIFGFCLPAGQAGILPAWPAGRDFGFALARPPKGFHVGPYITLSGGLMQFSWDVNQRTRVEEANAWQPMIHLGFGWNLFDWVAPELNIRFTTDQNEGRREYVAAANMGFNFFALLDPLLNFEKWRILPFLKPGGIVQIASLPGDTTAADNRVTSIGLGFGTGWGVRFLFKDYLYFGVEAEQDWIHQESRRQNLTSGTTALIYRGGWKRQLEGLLTIGVHF